MGLASFNRMRLRRKEEMRPEKIIEASTKNVVEANPARVNPEREAYEQKVIDEAKAKAFEAMEAKNKSKEKEPVKRGSSRRK